jgi:ribonuclease HII
LDEAGRGAWAGPVVEAAVILPYNHPETTTTLSSVRDSKLLSPRPARGVLRTDRARHALAYGVGWATADEIDRIGIVPATRLAMSQAIQSLAMSPDHLLIDALPLPI